MADWRQFGETLRGLRLAAGLTQEQLAERSGVPLDTLQSYEQGRRRPGQAAIGEMAKAVSASEQSRAALYEAAGRDMPGSSLFSLFVRGRGRPETIAEQLAAQTWVSFVTNERHEIVGWNGLANAVAGTDLGELLPQPRDRNLLWMACHTHYENITNWDEIIGRLLAALRDEGVNFDAPGGGGISPYFLAMIARLQREARRRAWSGSTGSG